jgi:hypothetical protein
MVISAHLSNINREWNIIYWIYSINQLCWQPENKYTIMKLSSFYVILLVISMLFASCSDDSGNKEAGSNTAVENSGSNTAVTTSAAKEKKSDIAVQGLKGKVEVMSEKSYFPEKAKKTPSSKIVFKYDKDGNRTELSNYKPDGSLNATIKSAYDANGNLTGEQTILGNGVVDVTSVIKTDAKGNKIEQEDTRPGVNALFNYKYYYKYDEKGQLVERLGYRGNGVFLMKYTFKYDDKGNKTEWIHGGSDSSILGRVVYKYNEKNNLIEETEYGIDNKLKATYTYSYEFDKKGNWTRQKKMQNNNIIEIKEREITYH